MHAMVLPGPRTPLRFEQRTDPQPGDGEIRVRVSACGVCRTDLHVVDAELPDIIYPIIPGHEIVGRIDLIGGNVTSHRIGDRVGIPWLGHTCGICQFCRDGMENLCDNPLFTGYTRDGGFATHSIADARYAFPLGEDGDDGHIVAQIARWQGRSVYAFTRNGDSAAQEFALGFGAVWAGASGQLPDT